jgi:hypothetical protein
VASHAAVAIATVATMHPSARFIGQLYHPLRSRLAQR